MGGKGAGSGGRRGLGRGCRGAACASTTGTPRLRDGRPQMVRNLAGTAWAGSLRRGLLPSAADSSPLQQPSSRGSPGGRGPPSAHAPARCAAAVGRHPRWLLWDRPHARSLGN